MEGRDRKKGWWRESQLGLGQLDGQRREKMKRMAKERWMID